MTLISGVNNYGFGLLWGRTDCDNEYTILISSNGHFMITKDVDGTTSELYKWTKTDAVNQGNGASNNLAIVQFEASVYFYINQIEAEEKLTT